MKRPDNIQIRASVSAAAVRIRQFFLPCRRPWMILTAIYALSLTAILRADFNYIDDMARVARGKQGWEQSSRYLSNFFSVFLHGDTYLTDISPLPQLLAAALLALAGILAHRILRDRVPQHAGDYIALIPLGISPYMLECLSYKYDSPYMALSVLAGVFPLLLRKQKAALYGAAVLLSTLVVCNTYQVSTCVLPVFAVILALKEWSDGESGKNTLRFLLVSAAGYLAGVLVYFRFIMQPVDTYVSTALPSLREFFPSAAANLRQYYTYFLTDFRRSWLAAAAVLALLFLVLAVKDSRRNRLLTALMTVLTLAFALLMAFGLYPFMTQPLFEPRSMYGLGILISLLCLSAGARKRYLLPRFACLVLAWCFFSFAFTYGNALEAQKEYNDFRISVLIQDLNELDVMQTKKTKKMQISGTIGQAPILTKMPQDYQMLNRLVPVTMQDDMAYWNSYDFYTRYGIRNVRRTYPKDISGYKDSMAVLKDTMYHTIYKKGKYLLIVLK